MDDTEEEDDDAYEFAKIRETQKGRYDGSTAGRKKRKRRRENAVDGRSMRATGRTDQFNFRVRAELKDSVQRAAEDEGISVAEWMERALETALMGTHGAADA